MNINDQHEFVPICRNSCAQHECSLQIKFSNWLNGQFPDPVNTRLRRFAITRQSRPRWQVFGSKAQVCIAIAALCFAQAAMAGTTPAASVENKRTPGYLGIQPRDTPTDEIKSLHLEKNRGAEILMVDHDGPAGKVGLRPHDIVLQFNGLAVEDALGLTRMIHLAGAGGSVTLSVLRDGQTMTLTVQLADRNQVARDAWHEHIATRGAALDDGILTPAGPVADYSVKSVPGPSSHKDSLMRSLLHFAPYTGIMVGRMDPQLALFFGVTDRKGLLVHSVEANSPAAIAGLRAGDVLLRVDNRGLLTASDWGRALRLGRGKVVALVILRDKHEQTLLLPLS